MAFAQLTYRESLRDLLGTGKGTFGEYVSLLAYGAGESFPFIRDLNLDFRHDIGASWDASYSDAGSGAIVAIVPLNDSASTTL
jgi:hypothetical protein